MMLYADAHNDLPSLLYADKKRVDTAELVRCGVGFQVFGVCTYPERCTHFIDALCQIRLLAKEAEKNGSVIRYAGGKIENKRNRLVYTVMLEGAEALGGDAGNIELFKYCGVRIVGLIWNEKNKYCSSAADAEDDGLTADGIRLIRKLNAQGIVVDLSHASRRTFFAAMETSSAPCMASHSNVDRLCPNKRNLTDEQLKVLIAAGSFVGLNFYRPFIGGRGDADDYFRHIDYCLEMGGEDAVGFGSDINGMGDAPQPLSEPHDFERMVERMERAGYPKETVEKIAYKNLTSFIERECGKP